ncbi:MAG TPA: tyrosine-type recombinase/integrase, partial [Trebonia sp.]|nr:tyrosine-type recombinase/integrase [Trebonia sp.]
DVWYLARGAVGLPELHFHDLRHTGNTMGAAQGASLKELMERMGHSSPRAAVIYLHATRERDQKIAAGMGKLFADAKKTSTRKTGTDPRTSGTQRARRPGRAPEK